MHQMSAIQITSFKSNPVEAFTRDKEIGNGILISNIR